MSKEALRALDRTIFDSLLGAEMADQGVYFAPGAAPDAAGTTCGLYLSEGIQVQGEFGQTVGRRDEIAILVSDVAPAQRGVVEIAGVRYTLTDPLDDDGSISRWVVRRG